MTKRNAEILRRFVAGERQGDIARRFDISAGRVRQIIEHDRRKKIQHNALTSTYGRKPEIWNLPDETPIEVLTALNVKVHGWATRVRNLHYASTPILTLGDLRRTPDRQLLREINIGKIFVSALRRFCPFNGA